MSEPVFTAHDGKVFYRGCYRTPDECERLMAQLRNSEWPDTSGPLAEQLQTAITEASRPSIPSRADDPKETSHAVPKSHAA